MAEYLEAVEQKIEAFKPGKTEEEILALDNIKELAVEIKRSLGTLPMRKVMQRIARLLAKGRKFSLDMIKAMFLEGSKEFTKALVNGKFDF